MQVLAHFFAAIVVPNIVYSQEIEAEDMVENISLIATGFFINALIAAVLLYISSLHSKLATKN
mgnify:CR=1 FL=1